MTKASSREIASRIALGFALCAPVACDAPREVAAPKFSTTAVLGRAASISVTAANPSFGDQGQTNESVTITGSGFDATSKAAWLRNGVVDTTITVTSSTFVSSTTLIATINISPKSPVDYRDIQVVSYASGGRTQGIGSLLFEVTQAVQVPGTSWVRSINDNGEATGTLASGAGIFYYNIAAAQMDTVSPNGTGYDISPEGTAIVGGAATGGGTFPYLFTRVGGTWQSTALPVGTGTNSGAARSMITDGAGQVLQIGGVEWYSESKSSNGIRAVTWTWQPATATWQRIVLPPGAGTEVRHRAISASGILAGTAPGSRVSAPAVWMPNGSGGYTLTMLNTSGGAVNGVRLDGGMIVGFASGAVYWLAQAGGTWSTPIGVPGCSSAKDIADSGRFILNDCSFGKGSNTGPAYADPPYSTLTRLGGLGPKNVPGFASGISHGGRFAGGYATVSGQNVGIYWSLP